MGNEVRCYWPGNNGEKPPVSIGQEIVGKTGPPVSHRDRRERTVLHYRTEYVAENLPIILGQLKMG
jgi:hypothetical protein